MGSVTPQYTEEEVIEFARRTASGLLLIADPDNALVPEVTELIVAMAGRTVEGLVGAGAVVPGDRIT